MSRFRRTIEEATPHAVCGSSDSGQLVKGGERCIPRRSTTRHIIAGGFARAANSVPFKTIPSALLPPAGLQNSVWPLQGRSDRQLSSSVLDGGWYRLDLAPVPHAWRPSLPPENL